MLYSEVLIQGPVLACSSAVIFSLRAVTTAAEVGSRGAFAASGAFQKLTDEKKRNGTDTLEGRAPLASLTSARTPDSDSPTGREALVPQLVSAPYRQISASTAAEHLLGLDPSVRASTLGQTLQVGNVLPVRARRRATSAV
jgi:hypothetical protein